MLTRIDHIGIACRDLEAAIGLYTGVFGLEVVSRETIADQGVREAMLRVAGAPAGGSYVQLLEPLGPDTPVGRFLDTITRPFGLAEHPLQRPALRTRTGDVFFFGAISAVVVFGAWKALEYVHVHVGLGAFGPAFVDGAATFVRVVILLIVASVIWVPIGVWIGMNPRVSRLAQPVVQVLASFPANFLFPFAAAFFVYTGLSLNIGGIFLMALGAQWYILFNVIAGASAIPTDLRELMTQFRAPWKQRWRELILPGVFPYFVTGGITAAGGAWNASIVAELANYGEHHLVATGLGAYIARATTRGDFAEVLTGVIVMSFYVVVVNRLVWRRLYHLAETKYSL